MVVGIILRKHPEDSKELREHSHSGLQRKVVGNSSRKHLEDLRESTHILDYNEGLLTLTRDNDQEEEHIQTG